MLKPIYTSVVKLYFSPSTWAVTHDEHPFPFGIGFDRGTNVGYKILLRASVAHRGTENLSRGYLEVGDQRLGSVPNVFKFLRFRLARCHRMGGMKSFQGLDAGFLIGAHQVDARLMEFLRLVIQLTDRSDVS